MVTSRLILRLLGTDGRLLGWAEHVAAVRGDGCLRASGPVGIVIDEPGICVAVSIHWADVNVESRIQLPTPTPARAGEVAPIFDHGAVIVTLGQPPVGLPPVTVRSRAVPIGVGGIGARGNS